MVKFNFSYDANVSVEQRIGFEMAAAIWASVIEDNVNVNLHIGAVSGLDNDKAVGGAIPIRHTQNYGIFKEYYKDDITSETDQQAEESLQIGNTVDFQLNGEMVDGNSDIMLTSAQAKALGMDKTITLDNGTTWDRTIVDPDALDGYIVVNNQFDWSYDLTRSGEATEGTLDFLSMALHEIGHNLGFVSGIDGSLDIIQQHSGDTKIEDFSALDLFRHTVETANLENADGSVSDVSLGGNAYFSLDGGVTNLGDLSGGKVTGDDETYQASHWKRMKDAMGIMDPTLAYKERLSLSQRDLQAIDALGWDIDYSSLDAGLNLEAMLLQAERAVANDLGLDSSTFTSHRLEGNVYSLSYGQLWQLFEEQMLELGYGQLWQAFELSYGQLWQEQADGEGLLELSYGQLWQRFEDEILELGYGQLWQEFQNEMFELGYGQLWQMFELSYGQLWQELDPHFETLKNAENINNEENNSTIGHSTSDKSIVVAGGDADDILSGSNFRDLMSGGGGDDLIDGKGGNDNLLGETGNDILYGWDGHDKLYGGEGDDFVAGENGNDKLYGEEGADILSGGFGNDLLDGGDGKDLLKGDAGNDVLDGGAGNDDVDGGESNDIVIGGKGEDIVSGSRGDDILYGDSYFAAVETDELVSLESLSEQAGFTTTLEKPPIDFWVRLEAEDMKLRNFNVEEQAIASGNSIISSGGRGEAKTKFSGPTGIYDIIVGYHDEKDGKGELHICPSGCLC